MLYHFEPYTGLKTRSRAVFGGPIHQILTTISVYARKKRRQENQHQSHPRKHQQRLIKPCVFVKKHPHSDGAKHTAEFSCDKKQPPASPNCARGTLFSITAPATAQDTSTWDPIQDRGTLRIGVT